MSLRAVFWGDAGKENGETGGWHMDVYQKLGNPSVKLSILMDFPQKKLYVPTEQWTFHQEL